MRRIVSEFGPPSLLLLAVAIVCYGIYFPWFGFYGDDWSYVYYQHLLGWGGPADFASLDHPVSGLFYSLVMPLLGETPLPYHIFNLLLRWGCAILFWRLMTKVWHNHPKATLWMAVLFTLYPGFSQQPISVEFILHFSVLFTFLLSLLLMAKSLENRRLYWGLTVLSMVLSANMFSIEYFVGLELMRPVLLWHLLRPDGVKLSKRALQVARYWLPYLLVLVGFFIWRVWIFKFPTYQLSLFEEFKNAPFTTLFDFFRRILVVYKQTLYNAWKQTLGFPAQRENQVIYAILVLISFVGLLVYFGRSNTKITGVAQPDSSKGFNEYGWQAIFWGLVSMLAGGLPFWVTGIQIQLFFPWDRSILPFIPGVCMVTVGLVDLVIREKFRALLLTILACLSVGYHYQNAIVYKAEWENLRQFFWQLAWRAPALQEGTILVSDDIPLFRYSDNNLNAPFNWTYAPNHTSRQLPYKFFDLFIRYGTEYAGIPAFEEGLPVQHDYRTLFFSSTTSDMLAVSFDTQSCLKILAPEYQRYPDLSERLVMASRISKIDHILTSGENQANPPMALFPEPNHQWCYFYQKMDLERQKENWQEVIRLGEESTQKNLIPNDPVEWLPLIEAYIYTQRYHDAEMLLNQVYAVDVLKPTLCDFIERILIRYQGEIPVDLSLLVESYSCAE